MWWAGWENVSVDSVISTGPCLLSDVVLLVATTGGDVTLYDGVDALAGRKIGRFEGSANQSKPIHFEPPLLCQQGLYVDVGANVTECLVCFISYQPSANPGYGPPPDLMKGK